MKRSAGEVVIIDPLIKDDWNELLLSDDRSTIFHSANWAQALAHAYGFRPKYFTLFKSDTIKGCIPIMDVDSLITSRRGVSLSFSDYCGSLADGHGTFKELFESIIAHGKELGWRFVEFRGEPFLEDAPPSERWVHHEVELTPNEDEMFARIKKNNSYSIKKAVREGVEVSFTDSLQGVLDYYRLHCMTRKGHGVPPQPLRFFKELHDHVIAPGFGFTGLAHYDGKPVAGVVCLRFGKHAVYKFGASDKKFQHLRPSNLLIWEAMRKCTREGCRCFSMGRTHPEQQGLLFFKNSWGATETIMNYHRYDLVSGTFCQAEPSHDGGLCQQIMKRLPVSVLRRLGSLYRHMG